MMRIIITFAIFVALPVIKGDLQATLSRCCALGANWASEESQCTNFTAPVASIPLEQLGICLSAVEICCLRTNRVRQCEVGKNAARRGLDCIVSPQSGGEYQKDCCEACKLGIITASMAMDCVGSFQFGIPWDKAYLSCCLEIPSNTDLGPQPTLKPAATVLPPIVDNICELYPGELCTDICVPTHGSYVCDCRPGFTLMSDGKSCEQNSLPNRCKLANPCSQKCIDTGVSIECACNPGYQLANDNKSCYDIDECTMEIDQCHYNGMLCQNEIGSYSCITSDGVTVLPSQLAQFAQLGLHVPAQPPRNTIENPTCPKGYQLNQTSKFCDDIDECAFGIHNCPPNSSCTNIVGSFVCSELTEKECIPGYKFDEIDQRCIDINECSEGPNPCRGKRQICVNTEGSFICQTRSQNRQCPPGLKFNSTLRSCEDVDECIENIHSCAAVVEVCRNTIGAYECDVPCEPGFQFEQGRCIDVNECDREVAPCPEHEPLCFNTIGGFECHAPEPSTTTPLACSLGYQSNVAPNGTSYCVDINECLDQSLHVCNLETETCVNEDGDYRCEKRPTTTAKPIQCPLGLVFNIDELRCVDVDECNRDGDGPCDSYQSCENTHGSYTCTCKAGFELDTETKACTDINECQANRHECQPSQRCDNTIGSYQCIRFTSCGTGYTLNAHTGYCEDDDECALQIDNCRELGPMVQCKNTLGSFRCQRKRCEGNKVLTNTGECVLLDCPVGFQSNSQGKCTDVNECEQFNICQANQRCTNTIGSYSCVSILDCGKGYEVNSQGTQCVDVNECEVGLYSCPQGQHCINRPGGYVCQCLPGFSLNSAKHCVDIDECSLFRGKLQVCSINSQCQNTPGSYKCMCKQGFKHDIDDKVCTDIDECNVTQGLCQHSCINTWGSYRCTCNSGFMLQSDTRTCKDIDECDEFKDRSLCVGLCVNTPGSYTCQCPKGYRMGSDGRTCVDIDECSTGNACRRVEEVCLNTRGSYFCNTIDCPPNYARETEHKNRCKRIQSYCREEDMECLRMPQTLSFNYITFVSNMLIPPVGHLDLFTMRGPLWALATVRFNLDLVQSRSSAPVVKATSDYFRMRRPAHNQAIISLVKSIEGPQQIELKLTMDMYHNGIFSGTVIAKLYIIVSEFEF